MKVGQRLQDHPVLATATGLGAAALLSIPALLSAAGKPKNYGKALIGASKRLKQLPTGKMAATRISSVWDNATIQERKRWLKEGGAVKIQIWRIESKWNELRKVDQQRLRTAVDFNKVTLSSNGPIFNEGKKVNSRKQAMITPPGGPQGGGLTVNNFKKWRRVSVSDIRQRKFLKSFGTSQHPSSLFIVRQGLDEFHWGGGHRWQVSDPRDDSSLDNQLLLILTRHIEREKGPYYIWSLWRSSKRQQRDGIRVFITSHSGTTDRNEPPLEILSSAARNVAIRIGGNIDSGILTGSRARAFIPQLGSIGPVDVRDSARRKRAIEPLNETERNQLMLRIITLKNQRGDDINYEKIYRFLEKKTDEWLIKKELVLRRYVNDPRFRR